MNFLGVDPDRMSMLLEYALTDDEFQAFFSSCQKRLILAGEHKIQRLPGNREEAMRTIVRFSEKAHGVLSEWLKTEAAEHPDHLVNQLAPRFLAIEREGVVFDEDEMRELARCGLDNLYSDQPDENWLQFLASELPHNDSEESESAGSSGHEEKSIEFSEATLEALVSWARGESPLSAIDDPRVRLLARVEEAARSGNPNAEVTGNSRRSSPGYVSGCRRRESSRRSRHPNAAYKRRHPRSVVSIPIRIMRACKLSRRAQGDSPAARTFWRWKVS